MAKKFYVVLALGIMGLVLYAVIDFLYLDNRVNPENSFLSPLTDKLTQEITNKPNTDLADKDFIHVLLLGIDRRSKFEGYRTDIMILASFNKAANRIVLTSIPRDLWYGGGRINALYITDGFEGMQTATEAITGIRPDRFVLTDFEDFSWLVDALGGVPVNVETTFTDTSYPVDATQTYQTVHFTAGPEVLTGERALIFSRSRKGDFDNGDWGRMRRQHLILQGMVSAITQPTSFVCTLANAATQEDCAIKINVDVITKALAQVTTGRMETNLQVGDLAYLWDFYQDRNTYVFESLLMDYAFLHTPPAEEYGGAWVLAPISGSYGAFHAAVAEKLSPQPATVTQAPDSGSVEDQTTAPIL